MSATVPTQPATNLYKVWSRRTLATGLVLNCSLCVAFCVAVMDFPHRTARGDMALYYSAGCAGLATIAYITAFFLGLIGAKREGPFPWFVVPMSILGFCLTGFYFYLVVGAIREIS